MKKGLLLVNLGSPDTPEVSDVRRYLSEFLMDKEVIDIPGPLRWLLVHCLIIPFRSRNTSNAYAKIWTDKGSPLVENTRAFSRKLKNELGEDYEIVVAMRYGYPSISMGLQHFKNTGINELVIFPLYPQWAASSTGTALTRVYREIDSLWRTPGPTVRIIPSFYENIFYLDALTRLMDEYLNKTGWDHLLLSYHGLPERHIRNAESEKNYCLKKDYSCCATIDHRNQNCYRAQCHFMTEKIVAALGIPADKYTLCFQSRLGRSPWILPNTVNVIEELARKGVKKIISVSPSFTADCLETIEEMKIRNSNLFISRGGEKFVQIPCLNDSDAWIKAASGLITSGSKLSRIP